VLAVVLLALVRGMLLYGACLIASSAGQGARPPTIRFQAGHIPSWHESCESFGLSPIISSTRRLWLLLLSWLLSADARS
jgi:hypothetical protein